jgi:RHS repeat-associated protein
MTYILKPRVDRTVTDTNLDYYVLEVAPLGSDNFKEVFRGTNSVTNGVLGKFDPSLLENDSYRIRLTAFDTSGLGSSVEDEISVAGNLKLGNFKLSFTDLTVPVTGIPINVVRTYDTLTANTRDDFGYGWRLEFRDTDLRTSLKKDLTYEELGYRTEGFKDGTRIYITLPGGERQGFTFRPKQVQGALGGLTGGRLFYPNFVADKGVTSTLTVPGAEVKANVNPSSVNAGTSSGNSNGILIERDGKLFNLAGRPYVPQDDGFGNRYLLTAKDGTVYEINATTGDLETVTDTNGNKLTYTDNEISSSTGQKVTFERDNQGRIISVTDPLGAKVQYQYDTKGDLVSATDRLGNVTKYEYNATRGHYLDKIIDPLGREAVKTEYDEQGRLKKTANSSGNGVEFVYDPQNSVEVVRDALGNTTTYEYDSRGNVVRSVDAGGGTNRLEYDEDSNLIKSTDANNLVTKYTYDGRGNLTSRSEIYCGCAGVVPGTTTYTYNEFGQQTSVTLPTGATFFQDYDSRGNLLALRDGKGSQILAYTYDAHGNVLSETSEGNTSTYKYDSRGNIIETKDADGTITKTEFDASNHLSKMIEADGSISTYTYDKEGRQTKADYGNGSYVKYTYTSTSPDWIVMENSNSGRIERKFTANGKLGGWLTPDGEITFTYDAMGRLWKETQPNGQTTEYTYDLLGRVIQTKDLATGVTASKSYSVGGQLLSETDSLGRTTSYTYDRNGKVASTTNALGQTYSYVYAGNNTTIIDPLGRRTTSTNNDYYLPSSNTFNNGSKSSIEYLYDSNLQEAKNYPTKIVDIGGKAKTYGYDTDGNLVTTSDLAGKIYTYAYSDNGVSGITSPTGSKINYEYDSKGNLAKLFYGTQVTKQYTYDDDGKLTTVISASGEKITNAYGSKGNVISQTVTNSSGTSASTSIYDANGLVKDLTNSTGTTSYLYDTNSFVSQITSANGSIISYERNGQGRITKQIEKANVSATGLSTQYTYDVLGKLLTVTDSRNRTTTMTYDVVNRLASKTLPNGVKTSYVYDELNRISNITYAKADGTVLVSETYTRNPGGEPSKVVREDSSYTLYEYDAAVRLSKETVYNSTAGLVESISYSYDLDGKRTKKVDATGTHDYNYNANGQLTTVGQDGYSYDADGRLQQLSRNGKTVTLSHDAFDHLSKISVNGTNTQYLYDAQGNRIGEVSGTDSKNYLVAPNLFNGLESTDLVIDGNGNVISDYVYGGSEIIARLDVNGDPIYYLTDDIGSVIGLVDAQGNRVSRITYDGFGEVKSGDSGTNLGGDFRFQGQWLETESGLYYLRARDYDAETGLFLSRDAVDVQQQGVEAFNPYQFAFNNPLIYSDPTGLITIADLNAVQVVEDILRGIESAIANNVRSYLIDRVKGVVTDIAINLLQQLVPTFPELSVITNLGTAGLAFEDLVTQGICGVIGSNYSQHLDSLWFEPKVRTSGAPASDGFHCGDVNNDLGAARAGARGGIQLPRPDFIIKNGGPFTTDPGNPRTPGSKAYLIGDIKITVKAARRSASKNTTQWQSILEYARFNNGHQYTPAILFFTLFGDKKADTDIAYIVKKANEKAGVKAFVTQLLSKI